MMVIPWAEIAQTVGGSVLGASPWVARSVSNHFRTRRPLNRFLALDRRRDVTIVLSSVNNPEFARTERFRWNATPESPYALPRLSVRLHEAGIAPDRIKPTFSAHDTPEHLQGNLIVLGGPIANHMAERVNRLSSTGIRFDGHDIVSERTSNSYRAEVDANGHVVRDYAIVIRQVPNPLAQAEGGTLVMIAGCYPFGTVGASWFITGANIRRRLMPMLKAQVPTARLRKSGSIEMVLSMRVYHTSTGHFSFADYRICEASVGVSNREER